MRRYAIILLAGCGVAAAGWAHGRAAYRAPEDQAYPPALSPARAEVRDVRIEERFVRAEATVEPAQAGRRPSGVRTAPRQPRRGLLARVGQLVAGEGKYKPSPFPHVQ